MQVPPPPIIARVKQVLSGDSLVLKPLYSGDEKTVSLAFVSAPRLKREGDEPYAFQARDALRKLVVAELVQFKHLYSGPPADREYGIVHLYDGQHLNQYVVSQGLAKVRDDAGKRQEQYTYEPYADNLRILETKARTEGNGLWSTIEDGRIRFIGEAPAEMEQFLKEHKGKKIESIVERIISGDRVAVRFLLEPKLHQHAILLIAGIRTPLPKRTDPNGFEQPEEEFGEEAKVFAEHRLLQRTVKVELLGLSPQKQLVGKIIHPVGNIAEFLLANGLARCVDFHSTMLGPEMRKLRSAEKAARETKLKLWRQHVVKKKDDLDAVVAKVISADALLVRTKGGVERKIYLSSIRQPKQSDPKQSPFQAEAKEFLRKKLIGKHVGVSIDGKRPPSDGFEEREMATVTFNDKNVALGLVEAGYASVIRHRREDEDRSPIYDELLAAEETAQNEAKGMYSPKTPQSAYIVDASESLQKAKGYLTFFKAKKRIPAVVDFIAAGSRFKVIVPRENAKFTFVLGGIRAPRTARNQNEESEPFGQEALEYSSRKCWQRDVEIDVEDTDRNGAFIGTMYVNRENVAKGLLEEGLASVHEYSAEKSGHAKELLAAQKKAQEARKGLWKDWSPEQDEESAQPIAEHVAAAEQAGAKKKNDYRDVIVTNVDEQGKLKVQLVGTGTGVLEELMTAFRSFHMNPMNNKPLDGPPKVGQLVAAKFTEDDTFYRAKIRHVNRETKEADVTYIDYGNSERLAFSRLRALDQPQFNTSKLKPQAIDAVFSFIQLPTNKDYANDAVYFINQLTAGKQLVASVDWTSPESVLHITLYDPNSSDKKEVSLNSDIVAEGLAMVPFKLRPYEREHSEIIKALKEKETVAKEERRGMWEYGGEYLPTITHFEEEELTKVTDITED
ncbi:hypothetical protein RUND412_001270 [Rhizina undulata]